MATELMVGGKAPAFSLKTESGQKVTLAGLKGQQVVLYFYPKDDTPGCTKEACGFRDDIAAIRTSNAVVLGISMDDAASHAKFIKKYSLPFSLLCDEEGAMSKAYGVYKEKNMYGRVSWGIERSTFLIDKAGKIKTIFRKVKVDGHVAAVQAALNA